MPVMHGPAFDHDKKIVNREVPQEDVAAFEAAGYTLGKQADAKDVKFGGTDGNAKAELKALADAEKAAEKEEKK